MRLYGAIHKVEAQPDGTVKVEGIASTEAVDDQKEVVRADAMRAAIPDYMLFPALREMHQLSAAGTTLEAAVGDDGRTRIVAHVVDPIAVSKVKNLVYRGFSIGGQVTARDTVNRKIITGITLNEISLVDRPANPEAILDCWKAGGAIIEGHKDMPDGGLATIGDIVDAKNAAADPIQIWACDHAEHRHVKKDDAVKCLEQQDAVKAAAASPAEGATAPEGEPGEGAAQADPPATPAAAEAQSVLEMARAAIERGEAVLARAGAASDVAEVEVDRQSVDQAVPVEKAGAEPEDKIDSDESPAAGEKASITEGNLQFSEFLDALIDEQVSLSAIVASLHKTITDPTQLEALVSSVIEKGARHGATDQVHLDNAEYCCSKALATRSASKTEKMDIADAHAKLLDAGATSISAPASHSPPRNATQDTADKAVLDSGACSIAAPASSPPPRNATQDTGRNAEISAPQSSAGKVPTSPMPKASDQELLEDAVNKVGASIATVSKAGGSQSEIIEILASAESMMKAGAPPHHVLMDMAHKSVRAFSNGSTCKADADDPERHSDMDMTRVHSAHYHIGKVGGGKCEMASGVMMAASEGHGVSNSAKAADTAGAEPDALAKAQTDLSAKAAENAELVKTVNTIVPMLTKLQERVEQIAATPIPAMALVRGGIPTTKAADNAPLATQQPSQEEIATALANMSEQDKTLTMIKASHMRPMPLPRSVAGLADLRDRRA